MGSTEIATGACTGRDSLSQVRQQIATTGFRLEELGEELERSFLSTNSPPLGLSSWSRNLLAQARAGHDGLRLEELREELERSFLSMNSPPLGLSSWSRNLLSRARAGHEGLREVFKLLPILFPSLSLTPIKFRISYFPLPFLSKRSPIWVGR
ncbi:hypothetical protein Taro_029330 [Colocasia esculenta]|uniref:Uncharacterized protein n=1 Tax=Colocasia esculenta TaxID=4460 RepID=A0A843VWW7_COLES|nr:hypothetical protein [Colocasia esculenta]